MDDDLYPPTAGAGPDEGCAPIEDPVRAAVVGAGMDDPTPEEVAAWAAIAEYTPQVVLVLDPAGRIRRVGSAVARVYGADPTALLGERLVDHLHPDDRDRFEAAVANLVGGPEPSCVVHVRTGVLGGVAHLELTVLDRRHDPVLAGFVIHGVDVTERVEGAARLAHEARHDALTGLPNRSELLDRLEGALADRGAGGVAALFIDLDGFKRINDSLGHAAGDGLLVSIAERFRHRLRPTDTVARLGGDEFVVVSPGVDSEAGALAVARRVHDAVSEPIDLDGRRVGASASVGIALAAPVADAESLLQQADTALYAAKQAGKNRSAVYTPSMLAGARRRIDIEHRLRSAIDQHRTVVHYQPVVDLPSGRMVATEALVRLVQADGALVAPMDFLEVAEDTGLVATLGAEVLRAACDQQGRWMRGAALPSLRVAVNVSPAQLRAPWLVDHVRRCLDDAGLPADRLCLELTEATLIDADAEVRSSLATLVDLGVCVALDDFGTGWSGLGSLRSYPVTTVKIDRSFVHGLALDRRDAEVVKAVVDLGHALGLTVSAEGVETQAQHASLVGMGCDLAQGYLYAPPMPAEDLLVAPEVGAPPPSQ